MCQKIVQWYIPDKVILFKPPAETTMQEYMRHNDMVKEMLDNSEERLVIMFDVSDVEILPGQISELMEINPVINHPKLGLTITFGLKAGMWIIAAKMAEYITSKVEVVHTKEEADEILRQHGYEVPT